MAVSPEANILNRTVTLIKALATAGQLAAVAGEPIRSVRSEAVQIWRVTEGSPSSRTAAGFANCIMPAIRVTLLPVSDTGGGTNRQHDERVQVAVQIIDNTPHTPAAQFVTYQAWANEIRKAILVVPNPFLQDSDVTVYDPYYCGIMQKVPAEARSLLDNSQQVCVLVFFVIVRHNR